MNAIEPIEIELDRKRHMLLTLGSLRKVENFVNRERPAADRVSIFKLIQSEIQGIEQLSLTADTMLLILWASLLHEDPELTQDQVGDMVTDLHEVMFAVGGCLRGFFSSGGDSDPIVEGEEKKAQELPNGLSSGPLPSSSLG